MIDTKYENNSLYNDMKLLIQLKDDLIELVSLKEQIKEILNNTNTIPNKDDRITEELKLRLLQDKYIKENKLYGETKVTTLRIYNKVKDELDKFIKSYPELKKQDIVNMAILEFIENHRRKKL